MKEEGNANKMQIHIQIQTFYRQDLPEGQLCRYCFTHEPILGFSPRRGGATRCTDQGEIWQVVGPLLPAKFHFDRFRGGVYGPTVHTAYRLLKKMEFYQYNCPTRGGSLARFFLQNFQGLCASSVYIILPNLAALAR